MATSYLSESFIVPQGGFSGLPDVLAPAPSLVSGENVWVTERGLTPRWKLSAQSIEHLNRLVALDVPFGNTTNPNSAATRIGGAVGLSSGNSKGGPLWLVGVSAGNQSALSDTPFIGVGATSTTTINWVPLSYTTYTSYASVGAPATPDAAALHADWRAAVVYSASLDKELVVFTNGDSQSGGFANHNRLFATDLFWVTIASISAISYSYLSGVIPAALDVTNFADRIVAWNCDGVPQRVQWHVEGDPTDWTGIGSGFQDLADMHGLGTRIFSFADQMVLASTNEIWRGRFVGLPYVFQFSPIARHIGMPYQRATIDTPRGLFWLGYGSDVYHMQGEQITPILPTPIKSYLADHNKAPAVAFFTYEQERDQLRLFHSVSSSSYPTRALLYDFRTQTFAVETYSHAFHYGVSFPLRVVRTASQGLDGLPDADWEGQQTTDMDAALFTSAGTVGVFMASATSELGSDVNEEAVLGPVQHMELRHFKYVDEARLDVAARSASSLSFGLSTDYGATYSYETRLAVSAASNTSQYVAYPDITGRQFTNRVRSTNGQWELRQIYERFSGGGEIR